MYNNNSNNVSISLSFLSHMYLYIKLIWVLGVFLNDIIKSIPTKTINALYKWVTNSEKLTDIKQCSTFNELMCSLNVSFNSPAYSN